MSVVNNRLALIREQPRLSAFYAITVAFSALFMLLFHESYLNVVTAFLPDFVMPTHRVHGMVIGAMFISLTLAFVVQLYRPVERVGAWLVAILIVGTITVLGLISVGTDVLGRLVPLIAGVVLVTALHPANRNLFDHIHTRDVRLLALGVIGALTFVGIAAIELHLQFTATDDHVEFSHYMLMAAGATIVAVSAIGAAVHEAGWRSFAWVAGFIALVPFGLGTLAFPTAEQGSTLPTVASVAIIIWALAFVGLAEYVARQDAS